MTGLLGHGGGAVEGDPGTYVGSTLYDVVPEHVPALAALVVLPLAAWVVHGRPGLLPPLPWVARLCRLPVERRVAVWMLLTSAFVHAAIVPTHGASPWSVAFAVDAVLLGWTGHALVTGRRRAGLLAGLALTGSLLGLLVGVAAGEMPDQVTMACKLVEVTGLLALWSPVTARPRRRVLAPVGVLGVTLPVVLGVWALGLAPAGGGAGHHAGDSPSLGVAMPVGHVDEPTVAQEKAADALYRRVSATLRRYEDPAVAVADGYRAEDVTGTGFHADNPGYTDDGRVLDPARPEALVYARRDDGSVVLLGAMFETPGLRGTGPAVGGPLTPWHAHEQVCFGLLPPSLAGLTTPLGVCPAGSVTIALTNEMIHVWTVPGAPQRFGDLPDEWVAEHVVRAAPPGVPPVGPAAAGSTGGDHRLRAQTLRARVSSWPVKPSNRPNVDVPHPSRLMSSDGRSLFRPS